MSVLFKDEQGEHVRNTADCPQCNQWWSSISGEPCECGGFFHAEYDYEDCTEDYSDCWDVYDYRCDKCGSTCLGTLA